MILRKVGSCGDFSDPLIYIKSVLMRFLGPGWGVRGAYQLLKRRLVDVALKGEVAEDFPGGLVALHLHRVGLDAAVVPLRTGRHHRRSRHALDVLREGGSRHFILRPTQPGPGALRSRATGTVGLTVLSLGCCCCSCFISRLLFLSLQRLFWNQTRMTRGLSPVISTSCSFMSASGRGLAL